MVDLESELKGQTRLNSHCILDKPSFNQRLQDLPECDMINYKPSINTPLSKGTLCPQFSNNLQENFCESCSS